MTNNRAETNKIWGYALAVGFVLFLVLKFPAGYSFWPALFLAILIAILFAILFWIAFYRDAEEAEAEAVAQPSAPAPKAAAQAAPASPKAATPVEKPAAEKKPAAPKKAPASKPKAAAEGKKDDLRKIKGLGPAMEKKLNAAGYSTYQQMGALKKAEALALDEQLGLGGRIERDEWVKQAKALAKG
ncbi:MAG: hypothetical protein OEZ19_04155 [Paracoccaceae bacterium]|nr:hypothetical protein [Paracoccaceae bacterium]